MITVNIYAAAGPNASMEFKGEIQYDGKKLLAKAAGKENNNLMSFIMSEEIMTPDEQVYFPDDDPEGWIRNLYAAYRSYALTASKPVED